MNNKKTILILGGGGYVGTLLSIKLSKDHFVVVYDTFWYGNHFPVESRENPNLKLVQGDIRDIEKVKNYIHEAEVIIHLACISNDPSYDLNPKLGKEINFDCLPPLIKEIKKRGNKTLIYASSSSVYGVKSEERVTEDLTLNPLTDYSKYKAKSEEFILDNTDKNLTAVIVRPATICGYSPRQRLDLSVNILTNFAVNKGFINVNGGEQHRPNLHIDDMIRAYELLVDVSSEKIQNKIYNIGGENLKIIEIAKKVKEVIGKELEIKIQETNDLRSYRVDSQYIKNDLGFEPRNTVKDAIRDLQVAFSKNMIPNSFGDKKYFNLQTLSSIKLN